MNNLFYKGYIKIIASVVPRNIIELDSLYKDEEKYTKKVMKVTGINRLRIAEKNKTTVDYCVEASNYLFENSNIKKCDVDGIVLVTQTSDYIMPASSVVLQDKLGLNKNIVAFDINYGCSGYIYGLLQSFMLVETGFCKNVLLCVGDTITNYINPKDKSLRLLMGDGASATIVSSGRKINKTAFSFYTDGSRKDDLIIPAGANRLYKEKGITDICEKDEYGNIRCKENLYMNGFEIMNFALDIVPELLNNILKNININKENIGFYGLHQANKFIVERLIKMMNVDKQKVPIFVNNIGNTGSTSIPILLSGIVDNIDKYDLTKTILCGFGVGLSAGIIFTNISETNILPIKEV